MHTLEQLASLTKSSLSGNKDMQIHSVADLKEAISGQISFVSNAKYISHLESSKASAVILNKDLAKQFAGNALINDNPYLTFAHVLDILHAEPNPAGIIHKSASIDQNTEIHSSAQIGANVVIDENVTIAKNVVIDAGCYIGKSSTIASGTRIYPNTTIYKDTIIGKNTIIHSGSVIGADGFGFAPTTEKEWYKIKQIGNVKIGNDVEIGANTTIDRAALGTTKINDGVKLDNKNHVGHNVIIDKHTVIAAGTVIGGSTFIGQRCQIGGATAIAGHLNIVDDVILTGRSMVMKSIKKPGVYSSGIATEENKKWRKNAARFRSLDEMAKKIRYLENKLKEQ